MTTDAIERLYRDLAGLLRAGGIHIRLLRDAGFRSADVLWRHAGERLLTALR